MRHGFFQTTLNVDTARRRDAGRDDEGLLDERFDAGGTRTRREPGRFQGNLHRPAAGHGDLLTRPDPERSRLSQPDVTPGQMLMQARLDPVEGEHLESGPNAVEKLVAIIGSPGNRWQLVAHRG